MTTESDSNLVDRLRARSDNAYCAYVDLCRRNECLGWEAKIKKGIFQYRELKAHKDAAEMLGRHRALEDAAQMVSETLERNRKNSD